MEKNKKICEKCKKGKSQVFNRDKYLCLECFNEILIHKFKANLRTSCKILREDYILVCISGGNFSMAMLEMLHHSFDGSRTNKKLFFKLKILYIDDSLFLETNEEILESKKHKKEALSKICKKYNFEYDIIYLEEVMKNIKVSINDNNNLIKEYKEIFNEIQNKVGFRTKFVEITIRNLIIIYALKNNFKKILLGNNGQSLVNNSFSSIITGNGKDIRHSIEHKDNTYMNGQLIFYRPCQDFFNKEILYFNHFNKVELIYPSFKEESITIVLSKFFEGLQNEKLNTVPSVLNTVEKILSYKNQKSLKCKFCLNELDTNLNLLEFGLDSELNNEECILNKELCYGCRRIFSKIIEKNIKLKNDEKNVYLINNILNLFKNLNIN